MTLLRCLCSPLFFCHAPATPEIYTLSLHDALPIFARVDAVLRRSPGRPTDVDELELPEGRVDFARCEIQFTDGQRSEEHTSELQSRLHLVCRLLLEKKRKIVPWGTSVEVRLGSLPG